MPPEGGFVSLFCQANGESLSGQVVEGELEGGIKDLCVVIRLSTAED